MARRSRTSSVSPPTPASPAATDSAGHWHEPLDPSDEAEPKPAKTGSSSGFVKKYGASILTVVTALLLVVTVAVIVKREKNKPAQQPTTGAAQQGAKEVRQEPAIPLASQPKSEWAMLTLGAGVGAKSKRVPVPFGMRVDFHGNDFRIYCLYKGREDPVEAPCPNGDMEFAYVTNVRENDENIVRYAYAPIGR